jgi:hypothetical protein
MIASLVDPALMRFDNRQARGVEHMLDTFVER